MAESPQARDSNSQTYSPLQRRSHMSISPRLSTNSWGNIAQPEPGRRDSHQTQNDLPPPPQSPRRVALRAINPDDDTVDMVEDFMMHDPHVSGNYHNGPAKLKREHRVNKKGFVGLMRGLRRFTGTVFGYGENQNARGPTAPLEVTHTGNTLPLYVSNPSSPVTTQRPNRPLPTAPHPDVVDGIPPALLPGVRRRPPPPAFHVTPPLPVSQRTSHHSEHPSIYSGPHVERALSKSIAMPVPELAQPNEEIYTTPGPSRRSTSHQSHLERSSHPTRIDVDDQGTIGRSPSVLSPARQPTIATIPPTPNPELQSPPRDRRSHPTSIPVRPLPTEDYRRMSKSIGHHTAGSSMTSYDPSFSTELSPAHGFFSTLWHMPWVSPDRITVDYFPGMSRGAWQWKKVTMKPQRSDEKPKTTVEYKPLAKAIKSWYTGIPPVSRDSMPSWAKSGGDPEAGGVDLLSSGTVTSATRSSMATSNGVSPAPRARRKRFSLHRDRDSQRLFYSPNQYAFTDMDLTSTPAMRAKRKLREEHRSRHTKQSSSTTRPYERRRTRHRGARTTNSPPPVPPVPPAAYMHGYTPYQPSTPIYLLHSTSLPQGHNPNVFPHQPPSPETHAYQGQGQQPLLSPLFVVPAMPTVVPYQGESFAGSTGTASPPGMAGRGAGGGHGLPGAASNYPGGFAFQGGMSPASPAAHAS
ncbi:hypothetical protein AAF712_001705 [Marasmius tenuissimus]|uniref:Uncharacterized protein n=1 Tax=Marasmius tenuissimus TaxID=585030 RepID=A0ABR3AAZ4_9AGAR